MILAANGLLAGFTISAYQNLHSVSVILCCLIFIISSTFCVCAIDLKEYKFLRPMTLRTRLKESDLLSNLKKSKRNIYATLDFATTCNRDTYKKMVIWTRRALICFLCGLIVLMLSFVYQVLTSGNNFILQFFSFFLPP
jgi:hypothetical protein